MSTISDKEIMKVISETLGVDDMSSRKSKPLNEAYVLEPKKYDIQTDILSQKAISSNIEDFKSAVDIVNEISAKLDSVDRSNSNPKDAAFRELKSAEAYNLNYVFLTSLHFDNIADPASKVMMDSLSYMRLSRDFGTFEDWQKDFIACAMGARNGYVATVFNGSLNRYMNVMVDENSSGPMMSCIPVICLCVKDSFYFRDYLNDRKAYIFAMMKELRWSLIEERFKRADKLSKIMSRPLGDNS
jgi:Fe-Mn family superoxide dismutase